MRRCGSPASLYQRGSRASPGGPVRGASRPGTMGDKVRLQLPERIPPGKVLLFSSLLMLVELIEGTDPTYAVLVFCYFMLSVFAFNIAGGFTRPSGAYVFFYSTLVAGVGTVYKALLGQAADTHLASPRLVMGVYVGA